MSKVPGGTGWVCRAAGLIEPNCADPEPELCTSSPCTRHPEPVVGWAVLNTALPIARQTIARQTMAPQTMAPQSIARQTRAA